jgi:hypothetical protein
MDHAGTIVWLAWTISIVSMAYALFVSIFQPYRRYRVLLSSYFTSASDASLITLWILATGGFESPFYLLWYVSLAAIAFRYSYRATLVASGIYAALYVGLLVAIGEVMGNLTDLVVRVAYIFFVGVLGGLIARESLAQTRAKVEMRDIAQIGHIVTAEMQLDRAMKRVVDAAKDLAHADRGAVYLVDRTRGVLQCEYADGLSADYIRARTDTYRDLPGFDVFHGTPFLHVADAATDRRLEPLREAILAEGIRTYAVFPLLVNKEPIGVLSVYRDHVRPFTPQELQVATHLAESASYIIENARLLSEMPSSRRTTADALHTGTRRRTESSGTRRTSSRAGPSGTWFLTSTLSGRRSACSTISGTTRTSWSGRSSARDAERTRRRCRSR